MSESPPPLGDHLCPMSGWVLSYCDGALSESQCSQFEDHLARCDVCVDSVDTHTSASDATLRMLSALPDVEDDEPAYQQLRSELMAAQPGARLGRRRLADPPVDALPFVLGNYELLECIGRGAWGAVYRARHTQLDQPVAVKVLDTTKLPGEVAADRFLQEAKAAGQLRHPNIVLATDAGQTQGLHYLAMELVHGVDAGRLMRRNGRLAVADACEIVRQAAVALDFAHNKSWVHRDVKPSNLMVTFEGRVQLLDLGIAGRQGDPRGGAEQPLGTAEYMAPEQWSHSHRADARADVYSLGCTLFKLLTGRTPASLAEPAKLSAERDDAPRRLERLVERMLSEDPRSRIASAGEVAAALRRPARGADLAALVAECAPQGAPQRAASRSHRPILRTLGRRRILVSGAAVAACAVAAPWALTTPSPRLRRSHWRPLAVPDSPVWFQADDSSPCRVDPTDDRLVRVSSTDLSLVQLGRAVSAPFALRVAIQQEDWQGGAGLFYRGRWNPGTGRRFQMIELRPPDNPDDPSTRRLLWTDWSANPSGAPSERTPLAEATVRLHDPQNAQRLEVVAGLQGRPVVSWNGQRLPEGAWLLSTQGRLQVATPPSRYRQECRGYVGLACSRGMTEFENPQLSYLA